MSTEQRPPIHCIVYGQYGSKKSTFAATFPKPMLVFNWDPYMKAGPYLRRGYVDSLDIRDFKEDEFGTPYQNVYNKQDKLIIRIEHYADGEGKPTAYPRFLKRLTELPDEFNKWNTIVNDSTTWFELAARHFDKQVTNFGVKDPRKHYGASADAIEDALMRRFGGFPMNAVVISHAGQERVDDVGAKSVYLPAAPGQMAFKLPTGFDLIVRAYIDDESGEPMLQTGNDGKFGCANQMNIADPCEPYYEALWENYVPPKVRVKKAKVKA